MLEETIGPALKFADKGDGVAFLPPLPSLPSPSPTPSSISPPLLPLLYTTLLPSSPPSPSPSPPSPPFSLSISLPHLLPFSPNRREGPCHHNACAQLVQRPGHNYITQLPVLCRLSNEVLPRRITWMCIVALKVPLTCKIFIFLNEAVP